MVQQLKHCLTPSCHLMFPYFDKCLADNAIKECPSVTTHSDNQMAEISSILLKNV